MKRLMLALAVVILLLTSPAFTADARADSQSLITLGFGVELGASRNLPLENDEHETRFVGELSARLRLFRYLGCAFAYNLANAENPGELSFRSKFRLTAFIYFLSTRRVGVYLMGGMGSRDVRDVVAPTGATTSYHAGLGLEIYVGRRFAFHAEYMWLVPGYASMRDAMNRRIDDAIAEVEDAEQPSAVLAMQQAEPELTFTDFLDAGNFQLNFGVRFYL